MRFSTLVPVLLAAGLANAQAGGQNRNGGNQNNNNQNAQNAQGGNNNAGGANALALNPANVQKASQSDGFDGTQEAGQAKSVTDAANFINFCTGKTLTNGLQTRTGSCNGIVMGDLPAANKMVSAIFTNPTNNLKILPDTPITFSVKVANLVAGSFTNPDITYYSAPQALQGGSIVGHTHISVQDLNGQADPANALDAETFAFFKGINDAGSNGVLSAQLDKGLPVGLYRVCSITSSSNHAAVIMPVAQRGPQDDCVRFNVTTDAGGAGGNNNNNNNNNNNQAGGQKGGQAGGQAGGQKGGQAGGQKAGQAGGQAVASPAVASAVVATSAAAVQSAAPPAGQQGGGFGGKGKGKGKGNAAGRPRLHRPKFAARDFVA